MKTLNTRFGEVEYNPEEVLHFPQGLVGFESLRNFIVMPNKKEGPLFWIQSVDDPDVAFILTDPTNFFLDYTIQPSKEEQQVLGIQKESDCYVLSVVTVTPSKEITLNLAAPILFSSENNRAIQVILENSPYSVKTHLPEAKKQ